MSTSSSTSKRISAFVRPQQSLHTSVSSPPGIIPTNASSLIGFPTRPDVPLHPLLPPLPPSGSLSDSFGTTTATAMPTILPYHPAPMWASSNVFYHFAPIMPPAPAPVPPPSSSLAPPQGSTLTELTSPSVWNPRPFHLPPPTGCNINGCQDCIVISGSGQQSAAVVNRSHFQNGGNGGRVSSGITSTTTSSMSPPIPLPSSSSSSNGSSYQNRDANRRKSLDSHHENSDDPDSPASLHVESSSNSVGAGEGDLTDEGDEICHKNS